LQLIAFDTKYILADWIKIRDLVSQHAMSAQRDPLFEARALFLHARKHVR